MRHCAVVNVDSACNTSVKCSCQLLVAGDFEFHHWLPIGLGGSLPKIGLHAPFERVWMTRLQVDTQTRANMLSTGEQHWLCLWSVRHQALNASVHIVSHLRMRAASMAQRLSVVASSRSTKCCHEVRHALESTTLMPENR